MFMLLLSILSMVHPKPSETQISIVFNISCRDMLSSDPISLALVMILALLLKYAVLYKYIQILQSLDLYERYLQPFNKFEPIHGFQ